MIISSTMMLVNILCRQYRRNWWHMTHDTWLLKSLSYFYRLRKCRYKKGNWWPGCHRSIWVQTICLRRQTRSFQDIVLGERSLSAFTKTVGTRADSLIEIKKENRCLMHQQIRWLLEDLDIKNNLNRKTRCLLIKTNGVEREEIVGSEIFLVSTQTKAARQLLPDCYPTICESRFSIICSSLVRLRNKEDNRPNVLLFWWYSRYLRIFWHCSNRSKIIVFFDTSSVPWSIARFGYSLIPNEHL